MRLNDLALLNLQTELVSRLPVCRRTDQIRNGHIHLSAIRRGRRSQHRPLVNKPTLPWMCEALQGSVEVTGPHLPHGSDQPSHSFISTALPVHVSTQS